MECNISFMLGLNWITSYKAVLDFEKDWAYQNATVKDAPLVRKLGLVYIQNCSEIIFREAKLRRFHRHFARAYPDQLRSVLNVPYSCSVKPGTYAAMESIPQKCDVCQRKLTEARRVRVSLPDGVRLFNRTVSFDIMTINGKSILQVLDQDTK